MRFGKGVGGFISIGRKEGICKYVSCLIVIEQGEKETDWVFSPPGSVSISFVFVA